MATVLWPFWKLVAVWDWKKCCHDRRGTRNSWYQQVVIFDRLRCVDGVADNRREWCASLSGANSRRRIVKGRRSKRCALGDDEAARRSGDSAEELHFGLCMCLLVGRVMVLEWM